MPVRKRNREGKKKEKNSEDKPNRHSCLKLLISQIRLKGPNDRNQDGDPAKKTRQLNIEHLKVAIRKTATEGRPPKSIGRTRAKEKGKRGRRGNYERTSTGLILLIRGSSRRAFCRIVIGERWQFHGRLLWMEGRGGQ